MIVMQRNFRFMVISEKQFECIFCPIRKRVKHITHFYLLSDRKWQKKSRRTKSFLLDEQQFKPRIDYYVIVVVVNCNNRQIHEFFKRLILISFSRLDGVT